MVGSINTIRGKNKLMANYVSPVDVDELSSYIAGKWSMMRPLVAEWADLARKAILKQPYNERRLAELEIRINALRSELWKAVFVASEHFTEEQIQRLQKRAFISRSAWKSLKKSTVLTRKNGFSLITY